MNGPKILMHTPGIDRYIYVLNSQPFSLLTVSSPAFLTASTLATARPRSELVTTATNVMPSRGQLSTSKSLANLPSTPQPSGYQERLVDWNSQSGVASTSCMYSLLQSRCNAQTNTDPILTEECCANVTLNIPANPHRSLNRHSAEADRANKPNLTFTNCYDNPCETENSSVSSLFSSGDCNKSTSPCDKNECCSSVSTITSDSSDVSPHFKTDKNDDDDSYKIRKMKDVDDILLGNLNTSADDLKIRCKFEAVGCNNLSADNNARQDLKSLLNLDLSSIKDDTSDDGDNNAKVSKCWKSPEEVRLGNGRVAALTKHFANLGDNGLIRMKMRPCKGRNMKRDMFKSVDNVSGISVMKESTWNYVPKRDASSSCSRIYNVGLGAINYSTDPLPFCCVREDRVKENQCRSCDVQLAGSGDKEFEEIARQYRCRQDSKFRPAKSMGNLSEMPLQGHGRSHCNFVVKKDPDLSRKTRSFVIFSTNIIPGSENSIFCAKNVAPDRGSGWPCETDCDQFCRSVSEDNILMVSQVNDNECLICNDKVKQEVEPYRVGLTLTEEQHFTSLRCKQRTNLENGFLFES